MTNDPPPEAQDGPEDDQAPASEPTAEQKRPTRSDDAEDGQAAAAAERRRQARTRTARSSAVPDSLIDSVRRIAALAIDNPIQRALQESPAYQLATNSSFQKLMRSTNALASVVPEYEQWLPETSRLMTGIDLRHLAPGLSLSRNAAFEVAGSRLWDTLQRFDPANWRNQQLNRIDMLALMEEGIPLVWTPSADVIRALLDAPTAAERRAVLEQLAETVVDDCREVLADVDRDDLKPEVGYLSDCLDSLGKRKYPGAQALASTVLDTVLRAMVRADASLQNNRGHFEFKVLAASLPKATQDTVVGKFRAYCLHTSIHTAYEPYFGPPVHEAYNRHATAHGAGPTQITLANALAAVMLAIGLLRELEETQRPIIRAD